MSSAGDQRIFSRIMAAPESTSEIVQRRHTFATTHWSVVLLARDGNSKAAFGALERLCCDYWRPVYAFVRREGYEPADAQELTQEFLSRFVHKEWLNPLKDQRGKFRSFLLTFLKHFLSDYRDHVGRLKRGGGVTVVPLEELETEENSAWGATSGPSEGPTWVISGLWLPSGNQTLAVVRRACQCLGLCSPKVHWPTLVLGR